MESKMENSIRFVIQREILISLLKDGCITEKEYSQALKILRIKSNCKLIVTSPNL